MTHLDLTLPSPAENLACDEALLDACEENGGEEILRFWEARETFVVVGYANKIATEVNVENCRGKKIPILRRCSGGGAVLQGAGCLNYALILRTTENSPLAGISSANQFIMERNRAAIETLFKPQTANRKPQILVRGHTDLCLDGLKFSGNSQRRRKNFLLFHGTFLLNFKLALVGEFLKMPSKQPAYRQNRVHEKFLANLNLPAVEVKNALKKNWLATDELSVIPETQVQKLTAEKYSTEQWNYKS